MSEKECSICFYNYRQDNIWTCSDCKQECHTYCIERWYIENPTCPFCRSEIKDLERIYSDNNTINIDINIIDTDLSNNSVVNTRDQSNNSVTNNNISENQMNNIIQHISNKLNNNLEESKKEMAAFSLWYITILILKIVVDITEAI